MTKILTVDDDSMNRFLIRRFLQAREGYESFEAEDGESGIAVAREVKPDLILMDLQMKPMNGFQATKIIKEDPILNRIPIIAVTAHADKKEECEANNFDGFISKPITTETLFEQIEKFLVKHV